ncbi:hypothetical protein [Streptomyces sp. NPDC014995]|uniref:hypothetical protein n=1 Tax=Streptomyces sp. NPDC014995 TaxID=3364936 RepID=UPI0036F5ACA2
MTEEERRHHLPGNWRQGGRWQNEKFGGEYPAEGRVQAESFQKPVERTASSGRAGRRPGLGLIQTPAISGDVPLVDYVTRYVERLNGVDERTKE